MSMREIKTEALVLRRTNYGEADRILNLITSQGKISAIAKGVRRARSKLAGGVEMLSLVQLSIHVGKGELGMITSAKMLRYYGRIVSELDRMEVAAAILKNVNALADGADGDDYFSIVKQGLAGLDDGMRLELVEGWCLMRMASASGEEINLYRDGHGEKLRPDVNYDWDEMEGAFVLRDSGEYGTTEIKMLRLMLTADLKVIAKIKGVDEAATKLLNFARLASRGVKHWR